MQFVPFILNLRKHRREMQNVFTKKAYCFVGEILF